jgi:oligopeptide transport system substrate-binding protein
MRNLLLPLLLAAAALTACTKNKGAGDNTLHFAVAAEIKTLDPIGVDDLYSSQAVALIYESLYTYHPFKRPLEVIPSLAAGLPVTSKDGLTHTIRIKPGVKFHDDAVFAGGKGREITANDFIYAWKRLSDPKTKSTGFWIFEGKIKGLTEWREKNKNDNANFDAPIEGFSSPDPQTIVIKLEKPFYQLIYVLAMTFSSPVPKEAVEKYGTQFSNHPIGTGPFMLKEWTRGSRLTLVKSTNWRGETYPTEGEPGDAEKGLLADAGKQIPFVDKVVISEINEDQPRWLTFMKGDIDFSSIPKDSYDQAISNGGLSEELKKKQISLDISADSDLTYTGFNMEDPILGKNRNLRLAMAHAADNKNLIAKFHNGRGVEAQSLIAPGLEGYDPEFKNPNRVYDVEKAKNYLKLAGYPEGKGLPTLEYSASSSSTIRQIAELFAQDMAAIGIKIKIVQTSWPQFTEKLRSKKSQIWGMAWNADYPDAENFLQLLYGPNSSPGQNASNYRNPEYDQLYKQSITMPPGPERTKVYLKMRDIFVREMPWIPNVHRIQYVVKHPWVANYKRNPMSWDFFKYVRIDTKKREELKGSL